MTTIICWNKELWLDLPSPIIILNQSEMLKFVLIKSIETDFLTFGAAWKYLFLQVTFLNFIEKAFAAVKG